MRIISRLFWLIVIVSLAVGTYLYVNTRAIEVETATVGRGRVEEYVTEEAQTQLHTERVLTAERAGTVRRIALEEGDPVQVGQVLTSLEDTELELSLGMLRDQLDEIEGRLAGVDVPLPKEAEIEAAAKEHEAAEQDLATLAQEKAAAEAEVRYAQKEFERIEQLWESGSASSQQHDTARRNLDVAVATDNALARRIEAARTAVEVAALRKKVLDQSMQDTAYLRRVYQAQKAQVQKMLELLVSESRIPCPIDGVLLEKYVDSEQFVQPGTPLVKVGDPATIEIRADILSDEVGRLRERQRVILVGRAVGQSRAEGVLEKIYPSGFTKISSLGVREQRVPVLIGFDNSTLALRPGSELDVKIVVAAVDDAVLLPDEAVFATADQMGAFVVEDGRARLRGIVTGLTGEDSYEVIEGVEPGEVVILRPPKSLADGRRVKTVEQ